MRARLAQLYWLLGDEDSSAAAIAEAQRCAERVTWPDALAELALSKAKLARWGGNAEEAYQQLGVATTMLGDEAEQANIRAVTQDLLGYLADDLSEAREHRAAAFQAASEAGHAPLIAQVLVGVADLALRCDQYEQAARLLAASTGVRGLPDRSHPDVARIEQIARHRLGEARFAEAAGRGRRRAGASWPKLRSPPERGTRVRLMMMPAGACFSRRVPPPPPPPLRPPPRPPLCPPSPALSPPSPHPPSLPPAPPLRGPSPHSPPNPYPCPPFSPPHPPHQVPLFPSSLSFRFSPAPSYVFDLLMGSSAARLGVTRAWNVASAHRYPTRAIPAHQARAAAA